MDWGSLILGTIFGGIIGYLISWYFKITEKEETWDHQYMMDRQILNRFLEKVSFEIDLIIEQIEEQKQQDKSVFEFNTIVYFRRLLKEDPFTLSFGDKSIDSNDLKPVGEARNIIQKVEKYITTEEQFNINQLKKMQSEIIQARLKVISMKVS